MRRYLWLIAVLAAGCAPAPDVEQERAELLAVDREWAETTQDPEKFLSYFAEGASHYPPGMPVVIGRNAIREAMAAAHKDPGYALSWIPNRAEVSAAGDIGYTTGTYQMTVGDNTENGKFVTVWKKQADGAWRVTEDIFNANEAPKPSAGTHVMMPASDLKWGDAPPGLPPGMRAAVVSGDPTQPRPYVLRAQLPANYTIPPHWHPTPENITVLSGTVGLVMGDTLDALAMQDVPAGGFASVPANMPHSFLATSAATIQAHGIGPFGITYVNPADDPRTKKTN